MVDNMEQEEIIFEIINVISEQKNIKSRRKNHSIHFGDPTDKSVFILHEGAIAMYRYDDDVLMTFVTEPVILGANIYSESIKYYIKPFTSIRYEILELNEFVRIIDERNLWKEFSLYQMELIQRLIGVYYTLTSVPTKELVINSLIRLRNEPLTIRNKQTAADYIIDKTRLSRSTVMALLSEFKRQGFLRLSKGILVNKDDLMITSENIDNDI